MAFDPATRTELNEKFRFVSDSLMNAVESDMAKRMIGQVLEICGRAYDLRVA